MTMELHKIKCDYNDKLLKRLVINFIFHIDKNFKKSRKQTISNLFPHISDSKVFFTKEDVKL